MGEKEYIEREALLAGVDAEFFKTDPSSEEQLGFLKCRRIIRELPAADVAPVVHAHWCYDSENGVYNCSRCGNAETSDGRYCSYCGAKMDGGKHG